MSTDGSGQTRLTNNPAVDNVPVFSQDSKHIAFVSNRDGNYEIYMMGVDGTNPRNLTRHPADDNSPMWSAW